VTHAERLVFPAPHTCVVETVEVGEEVGPGQVLIRNRVGLISPGTELAIFTRTHRGFDDPHHWAGYPWWPGYCSVGDVVVVGEGVRNVQPGDRVVHEGTHGTHAVQHGASVVKVGPELADERAVFTKLLGIALTPQLVAPISFGECAVVLGLGLVGNLAAQLCRHAGAWEVYGADRSAPRLAVARECGVHAWDVSDRSLESWVRDVVPAPGPQYVIEAVGLGATVRDAVRVTAPGGRTIILSSPRETIELDPYFDIHHPARQVIGAHESARDRRARQPYDAFLHDLLASGRVAVDPLVTHRVPFGADVQRAYEGLRDHPDEWLGVLIEYGSR
jgi:threonine dehydrogenase-like Zn-dependent dehydrogenase